ncbi:MAG: hypothetical protein HYR96_12500 [Deltaproteobacteria bacterium]|nr:hypothetical protein [Deltaproteobacteria bacterium]MBI3296153.1 hypothetical protein [Deltaproteobacteria bacterium]
METQKLFNLLVVGGALLGNYVTAAGPQLSPSTAGAVNDEPPQQEQLQPIFCDQPGSCVPGACGGKPHAKPGFECCWGTSCDDPTQE